MPVLRSRSRDQAEAPAVFDCRQGRWKNDCRYGAPGKGNTLLNYCGIRTDFIDFTVDRNPYKQGKFLPGTHIPIYHPDKISEVRPDYVFILPWNFKERDHETAVFYPATGTEEIYPFPSHR